MSSLSSAKIQNHAINVKSCFRSLKLYSKNFKMKRVEHVYTYMNDHYNPSVKITTQASHYSYFVCVNFVYMSGGTSFYSNFFLKFSTEIPWEEVAAKIFFRFRFVRNVWPGAWTVASCLRIHHITYY